jgi:uncharacterized protein YxjI
MKYQMRQKFWTLGDQFTIKDEMGNDVFFVKGRIFSIGDKLSFQDMSGNELAYISQRLLSLMPIYEIYRGDDLFAEVVKQLSFFRDEYVVDIPGPNDYQVSGDFWDHEYRFIRGGREVAHVSKKFFTWPDTYGVI